jgi:hypothetical protein
MASIEDGQVSHVEFTTDEDYAAYLIGRLEKGAAERSGRSRQEVRPELARNIGIAPGTIENLLRKRIKAITTNVYDAIVAAADRELRREIGRLEHERTILAAKGGRAARVDLGKVDAHLAAAREALGKEG